MIEPKNDLDSESAGFIDGPEVTIDGSALEKAIREIIELERQYFFEKRNVKTERQRKLREIIERQVRPGK
jgi:hypothetical protein